VTRHGAGYTLELAIIDAATERVLDQRTINAETAAAPLLADKSIREATYGLTFAALKQEVALARNKPDDKLDVRDLAFRAMIDWSSDIPDRAAVYATTMKSLNRALALASDDLLTLQLTAGVNLCECLKAWAADIRPMEDIGVAALDRGLTLRPDWPAMLKLRFWNYYKHGQYQEALLVTDALTAKLPDDGEVLQDRAVALLALGDAGQALSLVPAMLKSADDPSSGLLAAEVYFANGNDVQGALLARKTLVLLTRAQRANSELGSVALVLAAAESRAGHLDDARKTFKNFQDAVPTVHTISQIKAWVGPSWVAPGGDAFWLALQRAGAGA
jgi:tetratricopeptide (TPR) repeat protein